MDLMDKCLKTVMSLNIAVVCHAILRHYQTQPLPPSLPLFWLKATAKISEPLLDKTSNGLVMLGANAYSIHGECDRGVITSQVRFGPWKDALSQTFGLLSDCCHTHINKGSSGF